MSPGRTAVVTLDDEPPAEYTASVYLCGPTPAGRTLSSWRLAAVEQLIADWDRPGTLAVHVPEAPAGRPYPDYRAQVEWEEDALRRCDIVLFHVPRTLPDTACLGTNVKWGRFADSGRAVVSLPPEAERNEYLAHFAGVYGVPRADGVDDAVRMALHRIGAGARRTGADRAVPLLVWRSERFRRWRSALAARQAPLHAARLLWSHVRTGADGARSAHWCLELDTDDGTTHLDGCSEPEPASGPHRGLP